MSTHARITDDSRSPHTQLSESSLRAHPLSKEEGVRSEEVELKTFLVQPGSKRPIADACVRDALSLIR